MTGEDDHSRAIRIVQVSDIHVSKQRGYFNDNFGVFSREMRANPPDLVIYSGDVSFDGAGVAQDIAYAREQIGAAGVPWVAIPGNHDIGEAPRHARLGQPVNTERIARWRQSFGDQWWWKDIGAWRIVGIDTALLASDLPEEAEQNRFLERALATRGSRPVLFIMHLPPYTGDPADAGHTTQAVPHEARGALLDRCVSGGVHTIACGHLHVYRKLRHRSVDIVWAPSTAFVNIENRLAHGWGFPRAGYIEWTLQDTRISHRLVEPPLMVTHDVGRWNSEFGSTTKMPPRSE